MADGVHPRITADGPAMAGPKYEPQSESFKDVNDCRPCLSCEERCPGFSQHAWRNICQQCKCPRDFHVIDQKDLALIRNYMGLENEAEYQKYRNEALRQGYTWVPQQLSPKQVEEYMNQLPNHKVPLISSPGERYRNLQLFRQLPKQDLSQQYCRSIGSEEIDDFIEFCRVRNSVALGVGVVEEAIATSVCDQCKGEIDSGDLLVLASKMGADVCWHPACFVCNTCDELLADLTYCHYNYKLYCERHFAQLVRPRCFSCDELIFSGEYTKAMEQNFHKDHLACFNCNKQLMACRYIMKEEHPYCIPCYQELFAHNCEDCHKPIGPDYKDLSYKDRHWHEFCFKCCECQKSLVNQPFASKNEKIYCSDCHDEQFAARCDGCHNPFKGGMKKFEYKGTQWHEECFCCNICKEPIRNKSFIPRDEEVICVPCFENQFAQRCAKCGGVLTKGGVAYKDIPWHRECFTCSQCDKNLAGEKFTSRDDKPYCADCYGDLFAKKCCRCSKAIMGFGGTKFISFEERHWHSDCFVCYNCKASMVGKGFLMNEGDILCPACGRT